MSTKSADASFITVRAALPADINEIMRIYASARKYMAENGNPTQWGTGYPKRELLESDMAARQLYVCCTRDGRVRGVFMLAQGDDPTYAHIENGNWLNSEPYATIHRIASDGSARGIFDACLAFAQSVCRNLRADTHADNVIMQRALESHGFIHCGTIYVSDGTPRLAYQRKI